MLLMALLILGQRIGEGMGAISTGEFDFN